MAHRSIPSGTLAKPPSAWSEKRMQLQESSPPDLKSPWQSHVRGLICFKNRSLDRDLDLGAPSHRYARRVACALRDKTSSVAKSDRRDGPGGRVGGTQRRYESVSGTPPPMSGGPIAQLRQVAPTSEGSPELAPVFLDQDDGATSRLFVHVCGQPKPLMTTTHESTRRITLRHRGRFVMSAQAAGQSCCRRLDIGHLQITATVGLAP